MRPDSLKTRIFLDSGDPEESRAVLKLLGFLDGQTTNPTLISKNPLLRERLGRGEKFSRAEVFNLYRSVVREISALIPGGSVSVEVYAEKSTSAEEMLEQGREMFRWIPNAHIKFPTTKAGLKAAEIAVKENIRVNMTLCFSEEQAAAVYAATRGAAKGQVFVSPFIGRLDDRGENGMDLIANIIRMYLKGDGHVEVLTASVRTVEHLLYAIHLGSDIITAPFRVLREWAEEGLLMPTPDFEYRSGALAPIGYRDVPLEGSWTDFNIVHELTRHGVEKFSADWNTLVKT